jgi:hypothetical protein
VFAPQQNEEPHAHILIGNIPWSDLRREVDRWPSARSASGRDIRKVCHANGGRWGALHYLFAQTKDRKAHAADVFSHCHVLLYPPIESDNLEAWLRLTRRRIQATAARRGARGQKPSWRSARARKAALARWSRRAASLTNRGTT